MSDSRSSRSEFGAFLKARRAELTPAQVGLADDGTLRRVPGLRRDEVARLATMSTDYYTRIEQGRVRASATVLASLVRALRLDEAQQAYLYELAGKTPAPRRRTMPRVRPSVQWMLDALGHLPAMVLGRYNDILAWNTAAAALYQDFGKLTPSERNFTRLLFLDPAMRSLFTDWEDAGRLSAALLRMETASNSDDPRLATLVGELSVRSPEFREWWNGRIVSDTTYGLKRFQHPLVGPLTLDCDTWTSPNDPDVMFVVLTAEPDTPEDHALRILSSWQTAPAPTTHPADTPHD
ncbi:helix-turn-helix domain-containing protein [Streptomyces griseoloalbus]|uniref:Transcriptional regulator with XRE-family HTH domain n=1 Tax=Streptomyces griseoloalbus TaxID=67303 RepID=A0A7W8BPS5_9ACTN|nr:helix-turn-helix transcriptional regulator [Streptomyces albaduncus]MBB5125863.1 transcriptional regulator with XRE-family HTH domain [Streptomyces albaduncus]GGW48306.1 transcriptional regulator [Streptomyces albaduncus]